MQTLKLFQHFVSFFHCRRAVTAIEYALIAALIAVAIIGAVSTLGGTISGTFSSVANTL